jgi:Tol biopolymer transport system component
VSLNPGTHVGPYEVIAQIGEGGMGEVYRATDTNLGRQVALKVLRDAFAQDPERLARFEREAKTLAALNHPNIAIIHGFEKTSAVSALVMELVEGPTLADRIARAPIPIDEALPIARQIAEALEAAHEQGIIHRDLKPANIKLRPDDTVKVLDFGLAKLTDPAAAQKGPAVTQSPSITSPQMTQLGVILGTAAYMSPEQAKGRRIDKRSDIWAFGCVLYEMLTGQSAFGGDDVTDTLAAIVRAEPAWGAVPANTPEAVRRLLRRCLTKDLQQRLPEITTARLDIQDAQLDEAPAVAQSSERRSAALRWAALLASVAAIGLVATAALRRDARPPELRVDIATPPTGAPTAFALSPDGLKLVFAAPSNGQMMLWLRSLEDGSTRVLAGTDGVGSAFWSPDSRSLGFLFGGSVKRLDLSDGSVRTLVERGGGGSGGGAWNNDGVILYAVSSATALSRLGAAAPGPVAAATTLAARESGHLQPTFLPDGRRFIYYVRGTPDVSGIYLASLDGGTPRRLVTSDACGVVAAGHLVFPRQGALVAQPFDFDRLDVTGEAFRIAEPVHGGNDSTAAVYAVSASSGGALAFRPVAPPRDQFVWFDRSGVERGRIPDSEGAGAPELSTDGRRVLATRQSGASRDLWGFDLARASWTRLTTDVGHNGVWSPEGRRIGYQRSMQGTTDLFIKPADLSAVETRVLSTSPLKKMLQWSPDGRFLLYTSKRADGLDNDILVLPLDGDRTPVPLAQTRFEEHDARFSPDGKWIAYQSNETGRFEIWAQPLARGERVQISTTGGAQVQWRGDGRELFYVALDERLMAVPLRRSSDGNALEPGTAVPLFLTRIPGGAVQSGGNRQQYVVAPDGQRFLVRTLVSDANTRAITLLLNWNPEAKK